MSFLLCSLPLFPLSLLVLISFSLFRPFCCRTRVRARKISASLFSLFFPLPTCPATTSVRDPARAALSRSRGGACHPLRCLAQRIRSPQAPAERPRRARGAPRGSAAPEALSPPRLCSDTPHALVPICGKICGYMLRTNSYAVLWVGGSRYLVHRSRTSKRDAIWTAPTAYYLYSLGRTTNTTYRTMPAESILAGERSPTSRVARSASVTRVSHPITPLSPMRPRTGPARATPPGSAET